MSSLTTQRIIDNAIRLGLGHTAESVTESAARADSAQMGYLDFVDHLLAEEVAVRESRRFRNALKLSGLPHHKTLDDFDYTFQPGLEPRRVRDLATLEFLTGAGNIAILGPPGVGKTHIAIGLAVAACQAGKSIYFTTLDDLVRKLKAADAANRLPRQLANLMRPSLLVIDEVGYLALDRDEANMFFQLISRRYEKGSTAEVPAGPGRPRGPARPRPGRGRRSAAGGVRSQPVPWPRPLVRRSHRPSARTR